MKPRQVLHGIAFVALLVVALMSITGAIRAKFPDQIAAIYYLSLAFGVIFWSWLLRKIYSRPRAWGLGVGIFLFLIIGFQSYLFSLALQRIETIPPDPDRSIPHFILFDELPIFIAAVSCTILRFVLPKEPEASIK